MHDHFRRLHPKLNSDAMITDFGDPESVAASIRLGSEAPSAGDSDDSISTSVLCQEMKRRRDALEAKKRDLMDRYDEKINALSKAIDAMEEQQV